MKKKPVDVTQAFTDALQTSWEEKIGPLLDEALRLFNADLLPILTAMYELPFKDGRKFYVGIRRNGQTSGPFTQVGYVNGDPRTADPFINISFEVAKTGNGGAALRIYTQAKGEKKRTLMKSTAAVAMRLAEWVNDNAPGRAIELKEALLLPAPSPAAPAQQKRSGAHIM